MKQATRSRVALKRMSLPQQSHIPILLYKNGGPGGFPPNLAAFIRRVPPP